MKLLIGLLVALTATPIVAADWVDGVPYTTDWEAAIKQARESGKMIYIYNGWQKDKV